jgi:hypothetical protein
MGGTAVSAAEALRSARATGVSVGIDGDDLVLRAPAIPATGLLDALSRHKATILAMLRRAAHGWQIFFNERVVWRVEGIQALIENGVS